MVHLSTQDVVVVSHVHSPPINYASIYNTRDYVHDTPGPLPTPPSDWRPPTTSSDGPTAGQLTHGQKDNIMEMVLTTPHNRSRRSSKQRAYIVHSLQTTCTVAGSR